MNMGINTARQQIPPLSVNTDILPAGSRHWQSLILPAWTAIPAASSPLGIHLNMLDYQIYGHVISLLYACSSSDPPDLFIGLVQSFFITGIGIPQNTQPGIILQGQLRRRAASSLPSATSVTPALVI